MLAKLTQDRVTALLIFPCWQTQPWFPQCVLLVKPGTQLLIAAHQNLLQLSGTNLQYPIWDRLSLVGAIFSGFSQQRDCHLTSPRSSEHNGGSTHSQHKTHQCDNCWTSATAGSLIPTIPNFLHT